MHQTGIEYVHQVSNVIKGPCSVDCDYCWVRRFEPRNPAIRPADMLLDQAELTAISRRRKRTSVFLCDTTDMFHDAVPLEYITRVIDVVRQKPTIEFLVLTKCPGRYLRLPWAFPPNLWAGATIDDIGRGRSRLAALKAAKADGQVNRIWASFEPLLTDMEGLDLDGVDWVIVGPMTGPPAAWPKYRAAVEMFPVHARLLVKSATDLGIPVFVKPKGDACGAPLREFPDGMPPKPAVT
jgi:protein gp37